MNVKRLRLISDLSQKEFSAQYGIPLKTLQNWEANKDTLSARICPSYVEALLERAIKTDFPKSEKLIASNIDENHLEAIRLAKRKIGKSPLCSYVKDAYLYGSTARGQAKATSDIDILLVLDETIKLHKKCNDWILKLKGTILSDDYTIPETDLHVVFGDDWKESDSVYFSNIRSEGYSIWY